MHHHDFPPGIREIRRVQLYLLINKYFLVLRLDEARLTISKLNHIIVQSTFKESTWA